MINGHVGFHAKDGCVRISAAVQRTTETLEIPARRVGLDRRRRAGGDSMSRRQFCFSAGGNS